MFISYCVLISVTVKGRKKDHLRICMEEDVEAGYAGFDLVRLDHRASPEISLSEVKTSTRFLGKRLDFPLIFEAITGGTGEARKVNKALARVAQEYGLGMGVGSQRAALENPRLATTYKVRDAAPDILLIGNLGAVQLNCGYGLEDCRKAVEMIDADALALHLNPLQEVIQPEGDTDFRGLTGKINAVASKMDVPVIVKEVGSGLDLKTARKLKVAALDCGGLGGTSWSLVESHRTNGKMKSVGVTYADWGTPTAESIAELSRVKKPLIASGGVRNGLDAAKCIALGADVVGAALPVLRAYGSGGEKAVREYVELFIAEFRTAMFLTGSKNVKKLKGKAR
ncbi:MAG: type 2 isopentenyl-diphosphate Delta-isomerase [Candidatus Altiarchaeales archaeon]|nr:type 2 isopentenyl-diphosphate Delta-isomerase [Candidatus Altiarchaeales archaeon]MBD3416154.1 type 2 isopentenyl-diphosphate Delta-isomerase [Candidatus Altiarchaeales archaeon]